MKAVFRPGSHFPSRLQHLLLDLDKRPADVERETDGAVKADTIRNWLAGRHFPEKYGFLRFCRRYGLSHNAARDLLLGAEDQRDTSYLNRKTDREMLLEGLFRRLELVERCADQLSAVEAERVCQRLESASGALRMAAGSAAPDVDDSNPSTLNSAA